MARLDDMMGRRAEPGRKVCTARLHDGKGADVNCQKG
jgi:hypothetical protein